MTVEELRDQLTSSLSPLFRCDDFGNNPFRIRTPLLFPDGRVVDVFVSKSDGFYTVTDHGDAVGWLWTRTGDDGQSPKQRELIADACQTLQIEQDGGELIIRNVTPVDLADAVMRVAQAEVHVGETARLWGPPVTVG